MEKVEVKLSYEELKELWNGVVDDPYGNYSSDDSAFWDFLYETERCADVLKTEYWHLDFKGFSDSINEDVNEILCHMERYWREKLFEGYAKKTEDIEQAFNAWWWNAHDIDDYKEE